MPLNSLPIALQGLPLMPDDPREAASLIGILFSRFASFEATLSDVKESLARQDMHIQASREWRETADERLDRIEATAEKAAETLRFVNAMKALMRWIGGLMIAALVTAGIGGQLSWLKRFFAWMGNRERRQPANYLRVHYRAGRRPPVRSVGRRSGNATNYGITQQTLSNWFGRPAEAWEVYALTATEAEAILRAWYYRGIGGAIVPAGVDLMQTDHGFNCGVSAAKLVAETIQRSLGVDQDGIAGPITTAAAGGAEALLALLRDAQEADYRAKANFAAFGREWIGDPGAPTDWKRAGRLGRRYAAALKLAGLPPE